MKILIFNFFLLFFTGVVVADTTTTTRTWHYERTEEHYRIIIPPVAPPPPPKPKPELTAEQIMQIQRDNEARIKLHVSHGSPLSKQQYANFLKTHKTVNKKREQDFVYKPTGGCVSPSEEDFVRCANEKMTQKSNYLAN